MIIWIFQLLHWCLHLYINCRLQISYHLLCIHPPGLCDLILPALRIFIIIPTNRRDYVKYSKVFPLSTLLDFKIPSKWYRRVVGGLELTSGLAMAFIPNCKIKNAANIILITLMVLAVYSHFMVSDPFDRSGPALVFTFMLTGRFVVWYQISRRAAAIDALNQAQANGLKID